MLKDHFFSFSNSFLKAFAYVAGAMCSLIFLVLMLILAFGSSEETSISKFRPMVHPNHNGEIEHTSSSSGIILEFNFKGNVGAMPILSSYIRSQLTAAFSGQILDTKKVRGIFLNISSPGGMMSESKAILELFSFWKEKTKIPVYVFVDGICASGGYHIACVADKILASDSALIGSIGVLLPVWNFYETMKKLGLKCYSLYRGKYKVDANPYSSVDKSSLVRLDGLLDSPYESFVSDVVSRRPINEQKLVEVLGAKVFGAREALANGLIDGICSSREKALSILLSDLGIESCSCAEITSSSSIKQIVSEMYSSCKFIIDNVIYMNVL